MTKDAAALLADVGQTLQGVRDRLADLLVLCPPVVADEVPPLEELCADADLPAPLQLPAEVAAPAVVLPQEATASEAGTSEAGAPEQVAREEPVR